jgi:hypothetical protein
MFFLRLQIFPATVRDIPQYDGREPAHLGSSNVPDREAVFGRHMQTLSREYKPPQHSLPDPLAGFGSALPAVSGGD